MARVLTLGRLSEEKVAEQPSDGRFLVLNLSADEDLDGIADANRPGNRAHGAERTAPPQKRLPECLAIGNAEQLPDVGARLARAVDSECHAPDAQLAVHRQVGHVRQAFDRDLLAKIARCELKCLERRAVDDEHGS